MLLLFLIHASQGEVTAFTMGFSVNFNNSKISGDIEATLATSDVWEAVISNGTINGAFVEFGLDKLKLNNAGGVTGSAGGIFTGTDGFVGAFSMSDGTEHIQGVGLLTTP